MPQNTLTRRHIMQLLIASGAASMAYAGASAPQYTLRTTEGRAISVWHWRPRGKRRGTILFSHGAASAPWKYLKLIKPWVGGGFEVHAPLHVDSTDHPKIADFPGLASWKARLEDMHLLADQLGDTQRLAAGHSYGGLVALTLAGAAAIAPPGYAGALRDARTIAAIAFSPPGPIPTLIDVEGYATLAVPALIQTGNLDIPPGAAAEDWRSHLAAYDASAPGGNRYALTLQGVDHYFGGLICRPEAQGPQQRRQLDVAVRLSTLFLKAYGANDAAARRRLDAEISAAGPVVLTRK
ncbi:MAG: alpha/beta fold hydrolase [Steroidobacteraceae bacterium]